MELKRQLEVVQKRLKDVYERDSHNEQGKIIYWILQVQERKMLMHNYIYIVKIEKTISG